MVSFLYYYTGNTYSFSWTTLTTNYLSLINTNCQWDTERDVTTVIIIHSNGIFSFNVICYVYEMKSQSDSLYNKIKSTSVLFYQQFVLTLHIAGMVTI